MTTPRKSEKKQPNRKVDSPKEYAVLSVAQLQTVYNVLTSRVSGSYVELEELLKPIRECYTLDEYLP